MRGLLVVAVLLCEFVIAYCHPVIQDQEKVDENLFEGDIILTSHDKVDQRENGDVDGSIPGSQTKRGAGRRSRLSLWKNKVIPYELGLDDSYKTTIQAAINEFHKHTCLKFEPRTNQGNWIKFVKKTGCWSSVGMKYWKQQYQEVSLGSGCNHKGTIMHELMHAIGFWHEQSRPDRNQYVEVLWENIKDGKAHNFNKYSHGTIDTLKRAYDLKSIMHYGNSGFSKNGKPTIQGIGVNKDVALGQRSGFSQTDIFEINALYDCSGPSNGWSSWSDFGPCDSSCSKIRQRFCAASDKSACPGANSYGTETDQQKCPDAECYAPVDGHWGRWSSWSKCNVTCGLGSHTRTRLCDDPTPKNQGKPCVGDSKEKDVCEMKRCGLGPDDCEFEVDMCSWSQADKTNYIWYLQSKGTSSLGTGPNGDITKNGQGKYVYAEASSPVQAGQVAKLQSKVFPAAPKGRCIQFAYSMYGSSMGSLDVYVIDTKTGTKSKIFSKSGNQGQGWHRTNATIISNNNYKISFEATRGVSYQSDVALDDIMFKDGLCGGIITPPTSKPMTTQLPTSTKHPITTQQATTSSPTTPKQGSLLDCDFEQGLCNWIKVAGTNKYAWAIKQGSTPSSGTGPDGDHTSGQGKYIYMETSFQTGFGQTTYLASPLILASNRSHCLSFYYHMYGSTMGSLNVYMENFEGRVKSLVFNQSGDQGKQWNYGQVTITSICKYKIVFEGVRGTSYRSDIALDDILYTDGSCP